jgi:hypothetical protein
MRHASSKLFGTKAPTAPPVWIGDLTPYARNARTHSDEQVAQIAASIIEFGFVGAVIADERGIVAGHGRVMAATKLYGQGKRLKAPNGTLIPKGCVPWVDCTGWSEAQRKAYILTDKTQFTPLRLRQMYESRMIVPAPFGDAPPPRYLNNGLGKADQLRAEIEREEKEAPKNSAPKGEGNAQPRSDAKPAAPQRASAAKPSAAVGKKPAQRVGSPKPAAKPAPKRASARSR